MEPFGNNTELLLELGGNVKEMKETSKKWGDGLLL